MRIFDRTIPVALFTVGLGLVSAFAFEGTGARDGVAPAVSFDTVPRGTVTAPALAPPNQPSITMPALAAPGAPGSPSMPGTIRAPELKRSLTPGDRNLTPAE